MNADADLETVQITFPYLFVESFFYFKRCLYSMLWRIFNFDRGTKCYHTSITQELVHYSLELIYHLYNNTEKCVLKRNEIFGGLSFSIYSEISYIDEHHADELCFA